MALARNSLTNERRFCWEQVLRTNRLFRVSQVFAPPALAAQLLPLYAFLSAIEEVCSRYSDEDVARRKLEWWRTQSLCLDTGGGDHPILRELARTGVHRALRQDSLARLFESAEARLNGVPPADLEDLRRLCRAVSQPQFELEMCLCGSGSQTERLADVFGASSGLVQLLRESGRRGSANGYWWVPLTLLARHTVSRADIGRDTGAPQVRELFEGLLGQAAKWGCRPGGWEQSPGAQPTPIRHLVVIGHLQARALRQLQPSRPEEFASELNRVGFTQLYQAWQAARRVSRL
jgi:phytoene synthase